MSGYNPHGEGRWDKGVTDSVEDTVLSSGREPTARELEAMSNEPCQTAHEQDAEYYARGIGTNVVQVRIAGTTGRRTYAYEIPRHLDVKIGDWVILPGNVVSEHGGFGVVKTFGRQGYDGPLKMIVKKIPEPDPLTVRMSVVKTKDQAAEIYDEAVAAGWRKEDLLDLGKVGTDRLRARGVR